MTNFLSFRYFRMAYGITCALCVSTEDIVYSSLPLYHSSAGVLGVGQCLINGCTLVLRRKFSASQFWDDCVKSKATVSAVIFLLFLCLVWSGQCGHVLHGQNSYSSQYSCNSYPFIVVITYEDVVA